METLNRKDFEDLKKKIEPIKKLALHDDADGISSAVLLSYIFNIKRVWSPEDFGEWPITPYMFQEKEEIPPDVCVDMMPQNQAWNGLAIDHHPGHPSEDKRGYQLIWGEVPTAVVIYRVFRDHIPREQRWKAVVGAVGDGQPETVPNDIWRENPFLLEEAITSWKKYDSYKLETSQFPLYLRLSSGLNACCKIPEKWYTAYSVLRNAKSPWDLLSDSTLKTAKDHMKDEEGRILRESHPIQLRNGIRLWTFASETRVERTLAWELWEKDLKTVVAVNTTTRRGSIRGVLAGLVYEHLNQNGVKASGHLGFGGLRLKPDQTADDIYKILCALKL